MRWFALSGVIVFLSQRFRVMALAAAPVSIVTAVQRLSIVFRLLFTTLPNRDHDILGLRTWIGIRVSVVGAVVLSLSTAFVIATVAQLVRRTWP